MARKSKAFLARSSASKAGWVTRRQRYGPSGRNQSEVPSRSRLQKMYEDYTEDDYVDVVGISSLYGDE
jgi:hypothetical protein